MSAAFTTDKICTADLTVYAIRLERDWRFWGCFILGMPCGRFDWRCVMDDFGNLVEVTV